MKKGKSKVTELSGINKEMKDIFDSGVKIAEDKVAAFKQIRESRISTLDSIINKWVSKWGIKVEDYMLEDLDSSIRDKHEKEIEEKDTKMARMIVKITELERALDPIEIELDKDTIEEESEI